MDLRATLLEPLDRLQKLTETALEEHGRLDIFSKSLQGNTIGVKPAHAIRFAYCCDCFRTVTDVVFSDGVLSEEEAEVVLPFVRAMAKLLKPIISGFESFETASVQDCHPFFSLYKAETVPFGYANEQTRWAGAEIAEKVALVTGDAEVANIYKQMIDSVRQAFLIGSNQNGPDHLAPVATTENSALEKESKILTKEFVLKSIGNLEYINYEEFTSMEDAAAELISRSQYSLDLQGMKSLSDSAAEALSNHKGSINLDGLTTLTDFAVKALSTNSSFLSLSGLVTLSDSAAKALARQKSSLHLNCLTTLSDTAAKALAKHQGFLRLEGLSNLTDTAAKALAKHQGNLYLNGLTTITDRAAKALAKVQGDLYLNGLTSLSDLAAESFAKHEGNLSLDGLTTISDKAAESLAKHEGSLSLDGLTTISDKAAELFAKHEEGRLSLSGLTTISDKAAESLAKHEGSLSLDGLTSLSDLAMKSIAKHQGNLYLDGLTTLSDSAAESLAKHEGPLGLHGLTTLSDSAAESLANYKGSLDLFGLTTLSDSAAASFAKHEGSLDFSGLTTLSDSAVESLAKHKGSLDLRGLTTLSDSAAESLAKYKGSLQLQNLTTFSDLAVIALAMHQGDLELPGLKSLSDSAAESLGKHVGELNLSGLTTLSDSAAESLAKNQGDLCLFGLTAISDSVAESLAKHEGALNLNSVLELSDSAAESLANHRGELMLGNVKTLSDSAVESLSKHEGSLHLDGLATLSDSVAESLAKHKGFLSLYSILTISDSAAESLGKHQGKIYLGNLDLQNPNAISDTAFDSLLSLGENLNEGDDFPADFMEAIQSVIQSNTFNRLKNFNYDSEEFISATFEPEIEMNEQADSDNNEGFIEDVDSIEVDEVAVGYESDLNSCGNSLSIKFLTQQNAGSELSHVELTDPEGTIINSLGMKLVPIQPGEFLMGDPDDEEGENAAHRVRITKRFYIGMYAVTQAEYIAVTNENPSFYQGKKRPVEHVSWMEADSFCQQLSEQSIEKSVGRKYRLPSEAEWEYACRAGSTTDYAFGEDLEPSQANFSNSDSESTPQPTLPVGSLQPNAWGLYDMHGNVWEWCSDWFNNTYYEKSELNDPKGPKKGTHHTLRGGSASVADYECISFFRGEARMDMPLNEEEGGADRFEVCGDFGFRVVCED